MRKIARFLCIVILLAPALVCAQQQFDDQIASKLFQNQNYEDAKEIYQQLYKQKGQIYHFNQYIECLFRLGDFDTAEKELKTYLKRNPNSGKIRVDLMYAYVSDGKKKKADEIFDEILKTLPDNRNGIINVVNTLKSRSLNDYALAVLDKGAEINTDTIRSI